MSDKQHRRQFLQTTLAAGTALTVGSAISVHGDIRSVAPRAAEANPPARPGRVRWHADFAAACTAARGSDKPVLLFHMLGRLDEKFC